MKSKEITFAITIWFTGNVKLTNEKFTNIYYIF